MAISRIVVYIDRSQTAVVINAQESMSGKLTGWQPAIITIGQPEE